MRLRDSVLRAVCAGALLVPALMAGPTFSFHVVGDDPGAWPKILSSIGIRNDVYGPANLFIVRHAAPGSEREWVNKIEQGGVVVIEGESPLAEALGIHPGKKRVVVRSVVDARAPKLGIVWEHALETPVFELPASAQVFAWERWDRAPVLAAVRRGKGAALWMAVTPGENGFERFPYLPQALADLGVTAPFRSARLWAFFDAPYRSRVDLDYFAPRWRAAGISALHVASWHYFEPNEANDAYLRKLIEACHRNGILVYAWVELPHVSEKFWADHPEWREKTGLLQDAQLDWRKLMNLQNPDCFAAAAAGERALLERFDWDGVNISELYFESLEGAANPARFTPLNDNVRHDFAAKAGFDPVTLFQGSAAPDAAKLRKFLDYRAELARGMQTQWLAQIEALRKKKPDLDLVLTHVDDRFDTRMRDLIGADAAKVLPLLTSHDFTFLVEDPATIWNLGPQRYPQIAERYKPITPRADRMAIDINVVERYQDVYPTKQQTGTELFQLVHLASEAFPRVALYFENSILRTDWGLLPASAAVVSRVEETAGKLIVTSKYGVGVPWTGPALVNGRLWPVRDRKFLMVPAGTQVIEVSATDAALKVLDFNGELKSARALPTGVELAYESTSRAMALLDAKPRALEVDGVAQQPDLIENGANYMLRLPRGQHIISVRL